MNKQYHNLHVPLTLLSIIFSLSVVSAQTVEYDNAVFSFRLHDSLQYEMVEKYPVYKSATIFLSIKEINEYDNAAKYADALENQFLDQDDVYTGRGVDTLDGWPVILLTRSDKSSEHVFIHKFYLFDNGKTVYSLSIAGYEMDKRIIDAYFRVTKSSFKFKTKTQLLKGGVSLLLPGFMTKDETIGFWSHIYNKDETIDIPVYVYQYEEKYEEMKKAGAKEFKSLKPSAFTEDAFTIGNMQATMYAATYIKKLKTTSREESKYLFHYCPTKILQ